MSLPFPSWFLSFPEVREGWQAREWWEREINLTDAIITCHCDPLSVVDIPTDFSLMGILMRFFSKIPPFVYFTGHVSVNVSWLRGCLLRPATCDFFILLVSSGQFPLMGSCRLSRQSLLRGPTVSFWFRASFVPPYSEGLLSPCKAQS